MTSKNVPLFATALTCVALASGFVACRHGGTSASAESGTWPVAGRPAADARARLQEEFERHGRDETVRSYNGLCTANLHTTVEGCGFGGTVTTYSSTADAGITGMTVADFAGKIPCGEAARVCDHRVRCDCRFAPDENKGPVFCAEENPAPSTIEQADDLHHCSVGVTTTDYGCTYEGGTMNCQPAQGTVRTCVSQPLEYALDCDEYGEVCGREVLCECRRCSQRSPSTPK